LASQCILVQYSLDNTFEALKKAIFKLSEFKVDSLDENAKKVYLTSGASWVSWGEKMTISLEQTRVGGTTISILSTPKTGIILGGVIGFFKNRENIKKIVEAVSAELSDYCRLS